MATLINRAINKLKALPKPEQDFYAREILVESEVDEEWARVFSSPENEKVIDHLSREAEVDIKKGDVLDSKELYGSISV